MAGEGSPTKREPVGTVTAVAVPPNHPRAQAFVTKFMIEAISNGTLRKAYDNNGLKDSPIRTQQHRANRA